MSSCVRGHHVYGEIWTATLGLFCSPEVGNVVDRYAVAVKKESGETVGHFPRKILRMCSMFIQQGGEITATVTGHWALCDCTSSFTSQFAEAIRSTQWYRT